jgi:hypothetical protein
MKGAPPPQLAKLPVPSKNHLEHQDCARLTAYPDTIPLCLQSRVFGKFGGFRGSKLPITPYFGNYVPHCMQVSISLTYRGGRKVSFVRCKIGNESKRGYLPSGATVDFRQITNGESRRAPLK